MGIGSGVRIGRILGIDIHIDWSWLLIFFLVVWNLVTVFGQFHEDWGLGLRVGVALVAAILFFASVLAHELAHSLVAQAQGVEVRNITLFLFGGVSNIQRHPPSPRSEFLIAIVGPITSIVLGVVFTLFSGVGLSGVTEVQNPSEFVSQLGPATTLLFWLGPINFILGIFNMIPGFPLDGGRVLRSILWGVTDNLRRATRWASYVGQGIAWLMIFAGISMVFGAEIPVFGSGFVDGLWLAFIGWFLNSASVQSYRQVLIRDVLEGVQVSEMMRANAPTVASDLTVHDLVHEYIMGTDDHAFPVVDGDRLRGLVTLEDVRSVPRENWASVRVNEIMTPTDELVAASPEEQAEEAMRKLQSRDVRQLPVVSGQDLVGLLRRRDIIKWLQLQAEDGIT